eukprot:925575-Ditylum_brightwellii.AAC.1
MRDAIPEALRQEIWAEAEKADPAGIFRNNQPWIYARYAPDNIAATFTTLQEDLDDACMNQLSTKLVVEDKICGCIN